MKKYVYIEMYKEIESNFKIIDSMLLKRDRELLKTIEKIKNVILKRMELGKLDKVDSFKIVNYTPILKVK
jgi:hypothetical protein